MSLKARERILELRETQYKLQKLQDDLQIRKKSGETSITEFLKHHKELSKMPGSTRDSIPFRFGFESQKRYVEMQSLEKLTLPPRIDFITRSRLKEHSERFQVPSKFTHVRAGAGLGKYPSLAFHTLLMELNHKKDKRSAAIDRAKKSPYLKTLQPLNSNRYVTSTAGKSSKAVSSKSKKSAPKSAPKSVPSLGKAARSSGSNKSTALLFSRKANSQPSQKPSKMSLPSFGTFIPDSSNSFKYQFSTRMSSTNPSEFPFVRRYDSDDLRRTVAYALESSNLMGVVLPTKGAKQMSTENKRGPTSWQEKPSLMGATALGRNTLGEDSSMSVREAVSILKRRKLPERNPFLPKRLLPHERGLIGFELMSGFEPQCAFFYRDRNGNYNPHLNKPGESPKKQKGSQASGVRFE